MLQSGSSVFQAVPTSQLMPKHYRVLLRLVLCGLLTLGLCGFQWVAPLLCSAQDEMESVWQRPTYEKKVLEIGQRILAANNIQDPIFFKVLPGNQNIDAQALSDHKLVTLGSGLFPIIRSDDELAAILSHEIAHVVEHKSGHFLGMVLFDVLGTAVFFPEAVDSGITMGKNIRKNVRNAFTHNQESEMDLIGIDLMVKAGYNPLAMESILTTIATDQGNLHLRNRETVIQRLKNIHDKIAAEYPQYLAQPKDTTPPTLMQNTVQSPPENKNDATYILNSVLQETPTEASKVQPATNSTPAAAPDASSLPKATPTAAP